MDCIVRSRFVLPVSAPPIEDGAVWVASGRVAKIGSWDDLARQSAVPVVELGSAVLLPGLVNAHCHLDYTCLAGQIPPPRSFTEWIKSIVTAKAGLGYTEYAQSWLQGARQLLEGGVTTVADVESAPELLPEVLEATPLRVASFLEMTGVKSGRNPLAIVEEAVELTARLPDRGVAHGISPHALYSTTPALLHAAAAAAERSRLRLVMHMAESFEEFEMFSHQRGPLFDWLKNQRDMSDTGSASPLQTVSRAGLLSPRFLGVHLNYLLPDEPALLARHGASVAHCPRSHAYFRHASFPCRELLGAGVNVCLGTDSLVTVAKVRGHPLALDLFEEMRVLARAHPDLSAEAILRMATVNGAAALGCAGSFGELREGALADMISVPWSSEARDPYEAVIHHSGRVSSSMIGGQWVIEPGS